MKSTHIVLGLAVVMLASTTPVLGDGMIVPVRPDLRVRGNWAVKYHHVDITVRDQVANVSINQEFVNTSRGMIEVEYLFPVPPDAAIDSMTLIVNGKEFAAKLMKADEARKIYEDIVRKKKDPALLEYAGFGLYRTRAFPLEPGKPAKVVVTYKNMPERDRDLVEVWYPLNTEKFSAKPIESVRVTVDIQTNRDLVSVYSPTHDLTVDRKSSDRVVATYEAKNDLPTTDFQLYYKAVKDDVAATLLSWQPDSKTDGYFMMLVSPNPGKGSGRAVPKDLVAVLDHSGSMSGKKLAQAKEALRQIVNGLNEDDRFNIVLYNDQVEPVFDELRTADAQNINEAMLSVDRLSAAGGTNIHGALTTALGCCKARRRPTYILFFTDGQPTVGKIEEKDILADVASANTHKARIFTFGVGYTPNVRLLDRIAGDHGGRSDYVKPAEPVEMKVSSLMGKIKNPVMTDLTAHIEGVKLKGLYPRKLDDLFDGDQIVLVGRYGCDDWKKLEGDRRGVGKTTLVIKGRYRGKERAFEYPVSINGPRGPKAYRFVEKLWAIRRVGWLLDQIQLHGKSREVIDELVRLSKDYGIMTPYTSFLADERTSLASREDLHVHARKALAPLTTATGAEGQTGAVNRSKLNLAQSLAVADGAAPAAPETKTELERGGAPARQAVQIGYADADAYGKGKKDQAVEGVRQVGDNQVLYRRGRIWVMPSTARLDLEKDKDKIVQIKRFSEKYFELARANTREQNAVLATQRAGEQLLVHFRGQNYQIVD